VKFRHVQFLDYLKSADECWKESWKVSKTNAL